MATVVLDRQHAGIPSKPWSRGAGFDLDGDGLVELWEQEANLTPFYIIAAERRLVEAGHQVICISDGRYSARHDRAKEYQADVYIACHINAKGSDRGVAFYDKRSSLGKRLAGYLAASMKDHLPELGTAIRMACYDDRAEGTPWLVNPWATIRGVFDGKPVGICYEPFMLDRESHRQLTTAEGLERVGHALADGIIDYLEE
jgi:hypothetical protein